MAPLSAEKKDELFRRPGAGTIHFGRQLSVVSRDDELWAAVQMGEARTTRLLIMYQRAGAAPAFITGADGMVHQPSLALADDGELAVVWNEPVDDGWEIRTATIDTTKKKLGDYQLVHAGPGLCLPPGAAFVGPALHVAWCEKRGEHLRLYTAQRNEGRWSEPSAVSNDDVDAFRPHLSAGGGRAVLAWDEYRDRRYQIAVAQWHDAGWTHTATLGADDERWLRPRTLVDDRGKAYVAWVTLKPVTDKLGIIDHWPLGMVARIATAGLTMLPDEPHPSDRRIVADLRDGLLASRIYKGYVGLRRNPMLSVNDRGKLYCVWEIRGETIGSTVAGPLLARKLNDDDTWDQPVEIADAGYGYAVADRFRGDQVAFACMRFNRRDTDVLHAARADVTGRPARPLDESRYRRWRVQPIMPEAKPARTIAAEGKRYRLFWADTHVHTVFSPDAEGELDELVNFARDQAGLDIVTLIDNDYYPHKALTEPEWRIHQALAAHFSKEGTFLWIPGYEFTCHRDDLSPDFNHRCVSFPAGAGPLYRRIDPDTNTDKKMIPALKAAGAMVYPHHCTYALIDNDAEWNVEATSSWRVCLEETDFTMRQLKAGRRLGFIGSSDTHRAVPGLGGARTAVLAADLSPAAVADAYRQRRLIATQGCNVFIDFRVNDAIVGSMIEAHGPVTVHAQVEAPERIDYLDIVRDGRVVHTAMANERRASCTFQDVDLEPGEHFYFLRVKLLGDPSFNRDGYDPASNDPQPFFQDSRYPHNLARARGPFAWASPVWVSRST